MIAEFMHFYPAYTLESVLDMPAKSFYSLKTSMDRLKGSYDQQNALLYASANAGGKSLTAFIDQAKKRAEGLHGLLREVRLIRSLRK